jgi:hypothetical protein
MTIRYIETWPIQEGGEACIKAYVVRRGGKFFPCFVVRDLIIILETEDYKIKAIENVFNNM